jgi:meckelin
MLRFGVATLLFFPLALGLYIGRNILYVKFVLETLGAFEDLCSLSNISMVVLTHQRYGYYIHGRSPSDFADASETPPLPHRA